METSPGAFYGDGPGTGNGAGPPVMAGGLVALSSLVKLLPGLVKLLSSLGAKMGERIGWNQLPGWVQVALVSLGVSSGVDILVDTGSEDVGLVPIGSIPIVGQILPGTMETITIGERAYVVADTWRANGVTFYRFLDGHLGVQNTHGVWRVWKPKKPIVIFASGNKNLASILRADKAIQGESRKIGRMLRNRGYEVTRKQAVPRKKGGK